jgi:nitrate/TMAO reductase-like tetraheme cytochrome c subunit
VAVADPVGDDEVKYPHGEFREACELCHSANDWQQVRISKDFDHGAYGFPLEGAHAKTDCVLCHKTLEFKAMNTDCSSCHQDAHQGEFGSDCSECHGTRTFLDRSEQISNHRQTQFPLSGVHSTLDCQQCHRAQSGGLQLVNTPTDCYACHESEFVSTQSPSHTQGGFSTDCTDCHGTVSWSGGNLNGSHDFFPLRGGHAGLECAQCHTTGQFAAIDRNCVACHQADYDGTTDPVHTSAGFSTECETCHSINGWDGASFDHSQTSFPLTGAHRAVACLDCHTGSQFSGTRSECDACHQADFEAAVDPNHVAGGFPVECETCHDTNAWEGASFDHSATSFPLTGAHATTDCAQCHVNNVFTGTSTRCYDCHRSDYDATNDPAHAGAGFGTDCEICHTTSTWSGAQFDHDGEFFPIYSGTHRGRWDTCQECHTNASNYAVFDCLSCHPHDDKANTDSQHRGRNGYVYESNACYDCHPRGRSE